jgi:glycine dehydrogenase
VRDGGYADLAGCKVVVVACDESGNINRADLDSKARQHRDNLAKIFHEPMG